MFYGTDNEFPYYRPITGFTDALSQEIHLHRRNILAITHKDIFVQSIADAFGSCERGAEAATAYRERGNNVRDLLHGSASVELRNYLHDMLAQSCTTVCVT
jgi:hypothetical protein